MRPSKRTLCCAVLLLMGAAALLQAQRFSSRFSGYELNEPPATEFIFARWYYSGFGGFGGGGGWLHDYPAAEEHINQIMSEATALNVERLSYRIVELDSPDIFKYPFSYISEAGEMDLSEEEVLNLREYINRGGFVMVDDFDNARSLNTLRQNLFRVFPERDIFPLTLAHPIFNMYYTIDALNVTAPYNYGADPVFYGYSDGKDGLSMIIAHNNDLGDFWEWIDQGRLPLKPSAEALRLGINFVLYAMTH